LVVMCGTIENLRENTSGFQTVPKEAKKYRKKDPIKNCVSHALADITKVMDASGYNPEYSIEEGIRELI